MNENWIVLRLNDSDRVIHVFEYEDMEEARESFDEELEVLGHRAALMPAWVYEAVEKARE